MLHLYYYIDSMNNKESNVTRDKSKLGACY